MSITVKNLIAPVQLGTSLSTLYTSVNARTILDKFTACNTSGGALTVDVHIVPQGGAGSATNKVVSARSLAANETYTFPELVGHVLDAGSFIQALASGATAISVRASGREVTG